MVSRCTLFFLLLLLLLTTLLSVPAVAQDPFIGEIRYIAFTFTPKGWAPCDGRILSIAQYPDLFSLLGTTYGGDGETTFALPDARGRVLIGTGQGAGLTPRTLADTGGQESVALTIPQLPKHTHSVKAVSGAANSKAPASNVLANSSSVAIYSNGTPDTTLRSSTITTTGGNLPHENMQPFLAMNCIIALVGIYPTQ